MQADAAVCPVCCLPTPWLQDMRVADPGQRRAAAANTRRPVPRRTGRRGVSVGAAAGSAAVPPDAAVRQAVNGARAVQPQALPVRPAADDVPRHAVAAAARRVHAGKVAQRWGAPHRERTDG
eukprot:360591-Chlamydomonas_euryale.AAC.7